MYNFCVLCDNNKQVEKVNSYFSRYEFIRIRADSPIKTFLKRLRGILDFNRDVIVVLHRDDYLQINEMDSSVEEYIFASRYFFTTCIIQLGDSETNIHPDYVLGEKENMDLFFDNIMLETR